MLAQPVMAVVFVLDEKINLGRCKNLTAEKNLRATKMALFKSATETSF